MNIIDSLVERERFLRVLDRMRIFPHRIVHDCTRLMRKSERGERPDPFGNLNTALSLFQRLIVVALASRYKPCDREQLGGGGCLMIFERLQPTPDPIERKRK